MKIVPVGKTSEFESAIKLAFIGNKTSQKTDAAPDMTVSNTGEEQESPGYKADYINKAFLELDDSINELLSKEQSISVLLSPITFKMQLDPGYVPKYEKNLIQFYNQLISKTQHLKNHIKMSIQNSEKLDELPISVVSKFLDAFNNHHQMFSLTIKSIKISDDAVASAQRMFSPSYNPEEYAQDHINYENAMKPLSIIIERISKEIDNIENLLYKISPKIETSESVPQPTTENKAAASQHHIQSFAALDDKTKNMLMKYWKIIYPAAYVDAQLKNF